MWNPCNLVSSSAPEGSRLQLPVLAPVSGKVGLLGDVPSPAYANGLFGVGVAIDMAGHRLQAPFDGILQDQTASGEQLRLRSRQGLELLIQLGIDSHKLMGEGFRAKLRSGQAFTQGQALMDFDLNLLKRRFGIAHCLVLISQTSKLSGIQAHCHSMLAGQEPCMTLHFR